MQTENLTRQAQLRDLLSVTSRSLTCVKVENLVVGNTAKKLNPPPGVEIFYVLIEPKIDAGATSPSAMINVSEAQAYPATTTLGNLIGLYDFYDITGNNNVQATTLCSTENLEHTVSISYYKI